MRLQLTTCEVRSWTPGDVESLAKHANNRNVSIALRDRFPHPYTRDVARAFIRSARERLPETAFAIAVAGEAVGGIGFVLQEDIERVSAEIGYWLAEPLWGRGITTEALAATTAFAIAQHGLTRLYARVADWNAASVRVLEKCGYTLEARLRRSAVKEGAIIDQLQYAFIAPADPLPPGTPG
ncbi:MAG TPA: GNAT family protein [Vicinamibacterales bacterium]|nr:GNAT family protein [Vicinamibacterales bacterium]